MARDTQNIGTRTSLVTAGGPYSLNYGNSGAGIVQGNGADWFGPLNPMAPVAPPEVKGRIFDIPTGFNLNVRPRAYEGITFEMLRSFADQYDLLRLLIETRKDQISTMGWNIVPRDKSFKKKGAKVPDQMIARINYVEEFFRRPDKELFWDEWLSMLLEDLLVLDAPTIYRRRMRGGQLFALQVLDGATIKRVIDDWGNTPEDPGVTAYQQILKGMSAVDYTTKDLIYRPRVRRAHKVYGYSPVNQIIMTINIGLRRQMWQLQSFTEGNIPEALIGTPDTWTPEQVRSFQEWFDMLLVNNTGERRRARFVPGDVAKSFVATKPEEMFGKGEEWLIRVMCFAFSISPQGFVAQMNRATAQTAHETAKAEGLAPLQKWVKNLIDSILIDDFNLPDLEFKWAEEEEIDPDIKSQIVDRENIAGRLTYNEARLEQGLDPVDHPNADRPMFFTQTGGWQLMFLTPEEQADKDALAQAAVGALGGGEDGGDGGDGTDGPGGGGSGSGVPSGPAEGSSDSGSPNNPPQPPTENAPGGAASKADAPFDLAKVGRVSASSPLDPTRSKVAKVENKLAKKLVALLKRVGKDVSAQLRTVKKADDGQSDLTPEEIDAKVNEVLASLDLSLFELSQDDFDEALTSVFAQTAELAIAQLGVKTSDEAVIFERVNERAVDWAEKRAAELVSFKDTDPLIAEATREMLRADIAGGLSDNLSMLDIAQLLVDNYAFSEERAQTIAATEVTSANSEGALASYQEAKEIGVSVKKSWLVLEDGCDICQENADAGAIDLDDDFPSGDAAPGAHPHCRCVLVPEVEGDGDTGAAEDAVASEGDAELADRAEFRKLDNSNDMSSYFPVDLTRRGALWAMGGNSPEATAEREASLLQFVPFDQCVATQDFCDMDKVKVYIDDPTAKGFAPMAYFDGETYAIQYGHHRSVAAKLSNLSGMSMNVKNLESD